jgi:hypothetical protein
VDLVVVVVVVVVVMRRAFGVDDLFSLGGNRAWASQGAHVDVVEGFDGVGIYAGSLLSDLEKR